ncbi:hypothetical protein LEP1GSC175_3157 [Leptospira santarosai str. HAI821]|nr:hypothetical protein LEP1GSC175_3157 [Leptospira santarosai str. HAI821]
MIQGSNHELRKNSPLLFLGNDNSVILFSQGGNYLSDLKFGHLYKMHFSLYDIRQKRFIRKFDFHDGCFWI